MWPSIHPTSVNAVGNNDLGAVRKQHIIDAVVLIFLFFQSSKRDRGDEWWERKAEVEVEVEKFTCCREELDQYGLPSVLIDAMTYDRARVFLLLRLRRRTRFFLHFALIFDHRWLWDMVSINIVWSSVSEQERGDQAAGSIEWLKKRTWYWGWG